LSINFILKLVRQRTPISCIEILSHFAMYGIVTMTDYQKEE
jgi:hypothetical protein